MVSRKKDKLPHGRPPHIPTEGMRKMVSEFSGMGFRQDQIAKVMGISDTTLRKCYSDELHNGEVVATLAVARTLHSIATDPDHKGVTQAAMFWMKTRGKWKESSADVDVNLNVSRTLDVDRLTFDERQNLREMLSKSVLIDGSGNVIDEDGEDDSDEG